MTGDVLAALFIGGGCLVALLAILWPFLGIRTTPEPPPESDRIWPDWR